MADNTSLKATKSTEKNKYPNAINRTTSESLRVGDSDKVITHPTTLSSGTANAKKKTSFQITSVTVGSRISNDGGDDSADDLDESHTDDISDVVDISRVTDIENETPSYSEDTFSKDDVFFNTSASLGSAPVIPTSSQYGLAIVANENCVNPSATCANNISGNELHVSVADNVINLVGVKHNENEMRDIHSHSGRNERFKVVKIESTEPFRRGRWMCMDYLDHSMVQQQQSQSNVSNNPAKESNDVQNLNAQQAATDSGISVSDVAPPVNSVDEQVPSNTDKGTQDHQQYTMNPNAGQTAPGGYPSVSPGQTMQSQPPSQVIQQHTQSVSLNTPMQQNILNTSQHQSLQAQQMQQVIANSGISVQQQPVQMTQQPPQQMQSQPLQMQPHIQQQQQQPAPQQVPVSQQMPPQQVQMQQTQPMSQMTPQQHIPQQQIHNLPISNQPMQVPQQVMQQIPQQSIPSQMQQQPQSYTQQAPQQPMQQHIQQPIHQMAPSLQPPMTQNQPSPQAYQQTTMQQCPPGLQPQQMMTVPQHQLPPQPQYTYTPQGIPMMTAQGQQQGQMMAPQGQQGQILTAQAQQGQIMAAQAQQGQMMTSQGQMMTMPPQVHQTSVPMQQTYSVTNMPPQQQSQTQQQQQPPPQQQQPQQQMSVGQSASMHHVPAVSIASSIAGYAPVATGQNTPTVVSQPNPASSVAVPGSSQTTPTVMQQQCYMMPQGTVQQAMYSSMPSSVVDAIRSDANMMEQVVQTAALLGSLAEVTSNPEDAPPTGEETESLVGGLARALAVSRKSSHTMEQASTPAKVVASTDQSQITSASGTSAVAIDNKIEQAMDLVKSHLMFAVREEVEVLKEKIAELMDRINHLEVENTILKANASQETLAQLSNLPAPPSSNNAP